MALGSPGGTSRMEARYFSMRACSKPASARSCEARTKTPGRPRTAERRVLKSPPVSGARKRMACWASFGDGDADAFFADLVVPGLDAGEPVVGGRVGGAAEEGGDEEVMDGLGGGEIGVQPDLVAGLEVGDVGDGQGAGLPRVTWTSILGPARSKRAGSGVKREQGARRGSEAESGRDAQAQRRTSCHHSILDG